MAPARADKDYAKMSDEDLAKELKGIPIEALQEVARRAKEGKLAKGARSPLADPRNDDPRVTQPLQVDAGGPKRL